MSFDFNYKFWIGTKKDIEDIMKRQNVLKKKSPITNPLVTYRIFSELYILYVELVNKLSYVYNYTFQVQKREVVRSLAQSAARRLAELKNELKNLELSEYVYSDKALIARKLNPYDLVIWRSPQFLYRRPPEIQNIVYERRIFMTDDEKIDAERKDKAFLCEAVILLQAHERARKARVYMSAIKYDKKNLKIVRSRKASYTFIHKSDQPMSIPVKRTMFSANFVKQNEGCQYLLGANHLDRISEDETDEDEINRIRKEAALKIQLAWRAHKSKKILKRKHIFKQTLYGMRTKKKLIKPSQYMHSVIETYKNEQFKKKLDEDFITLISDERTRVLQERSPWLMEDISDHIRGWFREFYDKVGDFHPYPDALKSGTVLVLIDETFTPEEFKEKLNEMNLSKEEKKKRAEKAKQQRKKEKDKIRKEKIKEAKRRKKMKEAGIYDIADSLKKNKNIHNNGICPGDRLGKIQLLMDMLQTRYRKVYVPGDNTVIDESLVPWRGRLAIRQYIPNKAHPYGIKLFKLCSTEGFTCSVKIYSGKSSTGLRQICLAKNVCEELCAKFVGTLYIDNFYTSYDLAFSLLNQRTHVVGTLRANKKYFPKEIISAPIKIREMVSREDANGIVVLKWKDKRDVRMLSTKHAPIMVSTANEEINPDAPSTSRRARAKKRVTEKALALIAYNKGKSGIDLSDQMSSYANPLRKGLKCIENWGSIYCWDFQW